MMKPTMALTIIAAVLLLGSCTKMQSISIVGHWHELYETGQNIRGGLTDTSYYASGMTYIFNTTGQYSISGANAASGTFIDTGAFRVFSDSLMLSSSRFNSTERYKLHFISANTAQLVNIGIWSDNVAGDPLDTVIDIIYLAR